MSEPKVCRFCKATPRLVEAWYWECGTLSCQIYGPSNDPDHAKWDAMMTVVAAPPAPPEGSRTVTAFVSWGSNDFFIMGAPWMHAKDEIWLRNLDATFKGHEKQFGTVSIILPPPRKPLDLGTVNVEANP